MIYFKRNPLRISRKKDKDCISITDLPMVNNLEPQKGMILLYLIQHLKFVEQYFIKITDILNTKNYIGTLESFEIGHTEKKEIDEMCILENSYYFSPNMTLLDIFLEEEDYPAEQMTLYLLNGINSNGQQL